MPPPPAPAALPWHHKETLDFISIRAFLENHSPRSRPNQTLWSLISSKMKELGHRRSPDQCKCKWKNLVNRYKMAQTLQGREMLESENGRPCPFFKQLHAVFEERAKTMNRLLLESEAGGRSKKQGRKGLQLERSSEDLSDEDDEDDESESERVVKSKKRKSERERQRLTAEKCRANSMLEVLEEFFQQQQRIEIQWREAIERREEMRRRREQEFRNAMENLEKERMIREQQWIEREEQRYAREEVRAEKRDALFNAILNRLAREQL